MSVSPETRHCVKYVKWELVRAWRERVRSEGRRHENAYPYQYASRDPAFMTLPGSVLWLVTLPRYRRVRQAPSLVARLEIQDVLNVEEDPQRSAAMDPEVRASGNYLAIAQGHPEAYFPLNNAFHTLLQLEFDSPAPSLRESYDRRDRNRDARLGPYFTIAGHFRRHRWLTAESIPKLERYAKAVQRGRRVFLSYKRSDFPDEIDRRSWPERLADELTSRDVSCWWDRWNLPQADEDTSEALQDDLLQGLLDDAVQQAAWFVALIGEQYLDAEEGSWPRKEWAKAGAELGELTRRHAMHRLAVFLSQEQSSPEHERWMDSGGRSLWAGRHPTPAGVADLITEQLG